MQSITIACLRSTNTSCIISILEGSRVSTGLCVDVSSGVSIYMKVITIQFSVRVRKDYTNK